MSTTAAKTLRREVTRAKGVAAGTVVTFDRDMTHENGESVIRNVPNFPSTITYAAIFVGGKWYFTGRGRLGQSAMTNTEFLARMAESDIFNLAVVTDTEAI